MLQSYTSCEFVLCVEIRGALPHTPGRVVPCLQQLAFLYSDLRSTSTASSSGEAATAPKICQGTRRGARLDRFRAPWLFVSELDGAGRTAQEAVYFSSAPSESIQGRGFLNERIPSARNCASRSAYCSAVHCRPLGACNLSASRNVTTSLARARFLKGARVPRPPPAPLPQQLA
jgi:hypothetical protein